MARCRYTATQTYITGRFIHNRLSIRQLFLSRYLMLVSIATVSKEELFVKYTTHSIGAQPTADTSAPDENEDAEQRMEGTTNVSGETLFLK